VHLLVLDHSTFTQMVVMVSLVLLLVDQQLVRMNQSKRSLDMMTEDEHLWTFIQAQKVTTPTEEITALRSSVYFPDYK